MKQINDGGTAFPGLNPVFTGIDSDGQERFEIQPSGGISLRDYFAAKVLPAVFEDAVRVNEPINFRNGNWRNEAANEAYNMADAMIKARKTK